MKKATILIIFCAFAACIFNASCQKEQALVNKIEGAYKIEKVVYIVSRGDSVATYTNSTMFFDDCNLKKQKGAQQCSGYIEIEGQKRVNFGYRPEKDGSKISMFFNIGDPDDFKRFGGYYITEGPTNSGLVVARHTWDQYLDKIYTLRIYLKK